jgi:putative holliday junction resolvase
MARILAIDYGLKRTGLAVTDPLKIIATALETVETPTLLSYLQNYIKANEVELILMGLPVNLNSQDTDISSNVRRFYEVLGENFPDMEIKLVDERFTSKIAAQTMLASGMKKKDRKVKGNIDKISAVIILQSYMGN